MTLLTRLVNLRWEAVAGSTAYEIRLDGQKVATAGPRARTTRITIPAGSSHTVAIVALPSGTRQRASFQWSSLSEGPPPPPPPEPAKVAPRTYNLGTNDSDPRFCTAGLSRNASGHLADEFSEYDDDGRSLGGRDRNRMVPGLKVANEMDHRGPCDPYTKDGRTFPPWPAESYLR